MQSSLNFLFVALGIISEKSVATGDGSGFLSNSKALSTRTNGSGHGVVDDNIARHMQVRDPLQRFRKARIHGGFTWDRNLELRRIKMLG